MLDFSLTTKRSQSAMPMCKVSQRRHANTASFLTSFCADASTTPSGRPRKSLDRALAVLHDLERWADRSRIPVLGISQLAMVVDQEGRTYKRRHG